ncbi:MAG: ACT domain-containing protein, partial [Syntrophales bacterium]|nr:ACT domain-containing protein [Syntrophales bacterium]
LISRRGNNYPGGFKNSRYHFAFTYKRHSQLVVFDAFPLQDTFGVINLIVDDPERAREALTKAGMMVRIRPVLAVLIDDKPGGLNKLTQLLFQENININNAYGFVLENRVKAVFVVDVDQLEKAEKLVEKHGFKTLDAEGLAAVEPFHYRY